jgi:hypothetical protein
MPADLPPEIWHLIIVYAMDTVRKSLLMNFKREIGKLVPRSKEALPYLRIIVHLQSINKTINAVVQEIFMDRFQTAESLKRVSEILCNSKSEWKVCFNGETENFKAPPQPNDLANDIFKLLTLPINSHFDFIAIQLNHQTKSILESLRANLQAADGNRRVHSCAIQIYSTEKVMESPLFWEFQRIVKDILRLASQLKQRNAANDNMPVFCTACRMIEIHLQPPFPDNRSRCHECISKQARHR